MTYGSIVMNGHLFGLLKLSQSFIQFLRDTMVSLPFVLTADTMLHTFRKSFFASLAFEYLLRNFSTSSCEHVSVSVINL